MMEWEDILKAIAFIALWFCGLYLREAVYRFMRNFRDKLRK